MSNWLKILKVFLFLYLFNVFGLGIVCAQEMQQNYLEYKKAVVLDVTELEVTSVAGINDSKDWQKVEAGICDNYKCDQKVTFDNQTTISDKNDRLLKKGDKIIVSYQEVNGQQKISMVDFDRVGSLVIMVLVCLGLIFWVGRWSGIRSLLSFSWIAVVLVLVYLSGLLHGYNIVLLTIFASVAIIIGSSFLAMGWSRKALLVIAGSMSGLVVAAILMFLVGWWSRFSVLGQGEMVLFKLSPVLSKLNLMQIVYSSIIIGAIGSMMDITISIVAGIEELLDTNREKGVRRLSSLEIYNSGINIGRNIMTAETNTMVLAYFGSALTVWLVAIAQNYQWNLLISFSMIFGELLRIMSGAAGIIASIPITAFLASRIFTYQRKYIYDQEKK